MLGRAAGVLHQFRCVSRTVVCSSKTLACPWGFDEQSTGEPARFVWALGARSGASKLPNEAACAEQQRHHVSTNITSDAAAFPSLGVDFLNQAVGIHAERELVSRLAAIWRISPRVLGDTVSALSDLLKPCGRDTAPHALWVLIRCPSLRYWSQQQLRSSYRQLLEVTKAAQLSQADTTAAVYRHPWMLNAAAATAVVRRTPPKMDLLTTVYSSGDGSVSTAIVAALRQHQPLPVAARRKRLATLLVQAQAFSTPVSRSSSTSPPYITPTWVTIAVKGYLLAAEMVQSLVAGLGNMPPLSAVYKLLTQQQQQQQQQQMGVTWQQWFEGLYLFEKESPRQ